MNDSIGSSNGVLIAIEGTGGSGKSTLASGIVHWLRSLKVGVVASREPGATPLGAQLRHLLLEGEFKPVPWADAFLFEADRAQTYAELIHPALAAGKVVVSDRNLYGTIAYQGFGSDLDIETIDAMNRVATGGSYPDLFLVVDVEPQVALARKSRAPNKDRFNDLNLQFQAKVREGYLFAATRDRDRAHVLDGSATSEEVLAAAQTILRPFFTGHDINLQGS